MRVRESLSVDTVLMVLLILGTRSMATHHCRQCVMAHTHTVPGTGVKDVDTDLEISN